jgi:hypothetical protein
MSVNSAKCPYCEASCSLNQGLLQHLRMFNWACCANCGLILKVTLNTTQTAIVALEKYATVINLGLVTSQVLKKSYPYSEQPIPENTNQELKKIMIGIRVNTIQNVNNPQEKVFKNADSQNWVINNLVPKIIPILNDYPLQVYRIMESLGFNGLLHEHMENCNYCGIFIPKTRQNKCPFCLNGNIPPPPTY